MKKPFFKRILVVFFLLFLLCILTAPSYFLEVSRDSGEEVFARAVPPDFPSSSVHTFGGADPVEGSTGWWAGSSVNGKSASGPITPGCPPKLPGTDASFREKNG